MEKKFVKTGNSYALVIPPSVLKILGIAPNEDRVKLSIEGNSIIITPIN